MARAVGLIAIPFIIYLSFFYVHFAVLTHSGTGDSFMSPAFQETLIGNELLMNSQGMEQAASSLPFNQTSILQNFVTTTSSL
jgi:dolichyl-phosphate-mannose--protein O-mannosyl transferase